MDYRRLIRRGVCLAAFACGACGGGGAGGPTSEPSSLSAATTERPLVELFSWWTAPGEAEALQGLVDAHQLTHPTARLFNAAAASGTQARETLRERLARNDPPDLFQHNAHDMRAFVPQHPGQLVALDDLFEQLRLKDVIYPELLENVTLGGHVYGMPVNIHRENSLFYNRALFAAQQLAPPTTFEEFLRVCATLKARGIDALATSHQGWILRIMFNSIAMGQLGSRRYEQLFTGTLPLEHDEFRRVVDTFANILQNYTNADAGEEGFGWTSAAQAVFNGDAAMFLHGDWAKGYFMKLGWAPGSDFGVVPAPGAADLFLFGVDTFSLPEGAPNPAGARGFLATIASRAGQLAFNRLKGSSSIRLDLPREGLDDVARSTFDDLQQARVRMPLGERSEWDDALSAFAKTRDREALVNAYLRYPPLR